MPVPFIMPKFDMDQETATIASWLKKEGDRVEMDEAVLVVETEKIAIEVPAPATGILSGICAKEGDVVPVTEVIAYIIKDGEPAANIPAKGDGAAVMEESRTVQVQATPVAKRMAKEMGIDLRQVPAAGEQIRRADIESYLIERDSAPGEKVFPATPAARRLGKELGVDLSEIPGSGPRGRIQAGDVRAVAALVEPVVDKQAAAEQVDQRTEAPRPAGSGRPAKTQPLVGMRRTIADRMQSSFQTMPHISLSVEVDVSALEEVRQHLNRRAEKLKGEKISLTALLVRICAWALEREPWLNSSLFEEQVYLWEEVNIGIATALPDGLIVPVIHRANQKTVQTIAAELSDLTTRARSGKLTLSDVQHGTFTISNLGMYGIHHFRAIINPPESGILAVGTVNRKPVVVNEQDEIAVRPMMALTLAADHRLVDGVTAARFLADVVEAVESPDILLY